MENKFKGKALNLIVIVEEVFNENKTASGFDLSGVVDANEKQKRGKVVSVGEGCPKKTSKFTSRFKFISYLLFLFNLVFGKLEYTIQEGDEVIFDKFKMTNFTQDGVTYLMIDYRDIVLVF